MDASKLVFKPLACPLCPHGEGDKEIFKSNVRAEDLTAQVFSARRAPDRKHFRLLRCGHCGLVRSSPVLDAAGLAALYQRSTVSHDELQQWAAQSYGAYFKRYFKGLPQASRIVEIGCGQGAFLEWLINQGYNHCQGFEPSLQAQDQSSTLKGRITAGYLSKDSFPAHSLDLICAFQVFDHLLDPLDFLKVVRHLLKPNGRLLMILHDYGHWLAQLLGERCPMVDVEHPFLYNKKTLAQMLKGGQMQVDHLFSVTNRYPLYYWAQLASIPLKTAPIGQWPISLSLGNMGVVASSNQDA